MRTNPPTQRSYLLRLWQTTDKKSLRASLFNVHDATEQHHFVTLDDLYVFLRSALVSSPDESKLNNSEPVGQ